MARAVIDTNIFVSALRSQGGLDRHILELCFLGEIDPLMGNKLYFEYEDLLNRDHIYEQSLLTDEEREQFFDDVCSICEWVEINYLWRPNLPDEADNHVLELAIAGGADMVLTHNIKDFRRSDLVLPNIAILTPAQFIKEYREKKEKVSWQH